MLVTATKLHNIKSQKNITAIFTAVSTSPLLFPLLRRRSNHLEEMGYENRNSVDTICNRVKQKCSPEDVTYAVFETDLCNASQRRNTARLLYFMLLSHVTIFIHRG
jgi:cobalamin biosynthesis protein CobD/CbiB